MWRDFAYKSKELNEIAFQLGEDPEELRDRVRKNLLYPNHRGLLGLSSMLPKFPAMLLTTFFFFFTLMS